jgi:hypothetical protein
MYRGCLLNACRGIILLEDGTLGVQEGDGDNSFSLGTGQRTQSLNGEKKKKKKNNEKRL